MKPCIFIGGVGKFNKSSVVLRVLGLALATAPGLVAVVYWIPVGLIPLSVTPSWDEYQFLPQVFLRQSQLLDGEFFRFFTVGEPFGYGEFFWETFAAIALPFHYMASNDNGFFLSVLRIISAGYLALASVIGWLIARRESDTWSTLLVAVTVATTPSIYLASKPFSVEYFAIFHFLLGILLITTEKTKFRYLGYLSIGIAVGSRPQVLFFALPFLFLVLSRRHLESARPKPLMALITLSIGAIMANKTAILSQFGLLQSEPIFQKLHRLNSEMSSDNYWAAIKPSDFLSRLNAWFQNPSGDQNGMIGPGILADQISVFLIVAILLATFTKKHASRMGAYPVPHSFFLKSGTIGVLAIVFTTNRVWEWYTLPAVFLIGIGLSLAISRLDGAKRTLILCLVALQIAIYAPYVIENLQVRDASISEYWKQKKPYYKNYVVPAQRLAFEFQCQDKSLIVQGDARITPIMGNLSWSPNPPTPIATDIKCISWINLTQIEKKRLLREGFEAVLIWQDQNTQNVYSLHRRIK